MKVADIISFLYTTAPKVRNSAELKAQIKPEEIESVLKSKDRGGLKF